MTTIWKNAHEHQVGLETIRGPPQSSGSYCNLLVKVVFESGNQPQVNIFSNKVTVISTWVRGHAFKMSSLSPLRLCSMVFLQIFLGTFLRILSLINILTSVLGHLYIQTNQWNVSLFSLNLRKYPRMLEISI